MHNKFHPIKGITGHPRIAEHPRSVLLKRLIIGGLLSLAFFVALGVTLVVLLNIRGLGVDLGAKQQVEKILQQNATTSNVVTISSGMGFAVPYDPNLFVASGMVSNTAETRPGWVSGESYSGDELKVKRNYTIVKFSQKKQADTSPWLNTVELSISTNFHKDYFVPRHTAANANKSDLDIFLEAEKESITKAADGFSLASATKMTINGKDFYQLVLENKSEFFGVTTVQHQYRYITVNDGSPYWMNIGVISQDAEKDVPQYEALIASVTFAPHDSGALAWDYKSTNLVMATTAERQPIAQAKLADSTTDATTGTSRSEGYVSTDSAVRLIAKNQLSTVRVGTLRCADLHYESENGATFDIANACGGESGSGSIISSDGYVLTNGHVVYISNYNLALTYFSATSDTNVWQRYYNFVIKAGYVTAAQIQSYADAYKKGDTSAAQKLFDIIQRVPASGVTATNDSEVLDIQTSDNPMHLNMPTNGERWSWVKQDGNVSGTLVGYEVDKNNSVLKLDSTETDVALIKINGSYPTVQLGSISALTAGDQITTIGYPAVVDDGITTTQKTTIPTVSQGDILDTLSDGGGHKLVTMSAVIAAGNSGGPAFDTQGLQVGINTYGGTSCSSKANDNRCFGKGIARDAQDITILLSKYDVSLKAGGTLTNLWGQGIDKFLAGDYSGAASSFKELDQKYPGNYLVKQFMSVAASQPTNVMSSSPSGVATSVIIVLLIVFGVIVLLSMVVVIVLVSRHKPKSFVVQSPQPEPQSMPPAYQAPVAQPVEAIVAVSMPAPVIPQAQPLPEVPQVIAPAVTPAPEDDALPPTGSSL